jgi:hypothetical protein
MSLELVNTLATFGTFLVIAGTAIAAIVQLRHARGSNQIAALNELRELQDKPEFRAAQTFVNTDLSSTLQDPTFRYQYVHRSARTEEMKPKIAKPITVGNYFESLGVLVKLGLIDRELALEMWSYNSVLAWEQLAPLTAMGRRETDDAALWENFEYMTVLSQDWVAAHPEGSYPVGVRRIQLKDEWLEADRQHAASLAPA